MNACMHACMNGVYGRACVSVCARIFFASINKYGSYADCEQSVGGRPEKRTPRLIRCRDRDSPACANQQRSAGMHLAASIQPALMPRQRQPSVRDCNWLTGQNALGSFDATSIDAATATAQRARLQLVPEATGDDRCANAKSTRFRKLPRQRPSRQPIMQSSICRHCGHCGRCRGRCICRHCRHCGRCICRHCGRCRCRACRGGRWLLVLWRR